MKYEYLIHLAVVVVLAFASFFFGAKDPMSSAPRQARISAEQIAPPSDFFPFGIKARDSK